MAQFYTSLANGSYETDNSSEVQQIGSFNFAQGHQLSFVVESDSPVTAGTVTVNARARGGDTFEAVPNGTIQLSNPMTLQFLFIADALQFVLSGANQTGRLRITDTSFEGN